MVVLNNGGKTCLDFTKFKLSNCFVDGYIEFGRLIRSVSDLLSVIYYYSTLISSFSIVEVCDKMKQILLQGKCDKHDILAFAFQTFVNLSAVMLHIILIV